jgi:hypothetical protein
VETFIPRAPVLLVVAKEEPEESPQMDRMFITEVAVLALLYAKQLWKVYLYLQTPSAA